MTLSAYRAKVDRLRAELERAKWYADEFDDYESQQAVEAARERLRQAEKNLKKKEAEHELRRHSEGTVSPA